MNWFFFAICFSGTVLCACRLKHTDGGTKPQIIARYVMWATICAFAGLCGLVSWYMASSYAMVIGLICDFILGFGAWKRGAPMYTQK